MANKNANGGAKKSQKTAAGKARDRSGVSSTSSVSRPSEPRGATGMKEENSVSGVGSVAGTKNRNASGVSRASGAEESSNVSTHASTSKKNCGADNSTNSSVTSKATKKDVAKAYEKYANQFTPKPKYFLNSFKAFITGGLICAVSLWLENKFIASGMPEKEAAVFVVIILVMLAQLLTGLGWFDTIGKHVGAGVIVPITGFANSMVAPAIEYKKEGIVLGVGAKLFSLAGPVLVSGITASLVIGVIYWAIGIIR